MFGRLLPLLPPPSLSTPLYNLAPAKQSHLQAQVDKMGQTLLRELAEVGKRLEHEKTQRCFVQGCGAPGPHSRLPAFPWQRVPLAPCCQTALQHATARYRARRHHHACVSLEYPLCFLCHLTALPESAAAFRRALKHALLVTQVTFPHLHNTHGTQATRAA